MLPLSQKCKHILSHVYCIGRQVLYHQHQLGQTSDSSLNPSYTANKDLVLPACLGASPAGQAPIPTLLYVCIYNFTYLFLAVWDLCCCTSFSELRRLGPVCCSVRASHCDGFSRAVWALGLPDFSSFGFPGSIVSVHRLSCSEACVIFLDQGLNPMSPALAGGFFTIEPPGKIPHPKFPFFKIMYLFIFAAPALSCSVWDLVP